MTVSVLFVCLGNICRSPTAHGIFEGLVKQQGLTDKILVDSAGTGDWHIGKAADRRTRMAAAKRGYDLEHLRARQVSAGDFSSFDYILAMDEQNLSDLREMKPSSYQGILDLFLPFSLAEPELLAVPDPYYGGEQGFEHVLDLVEEASHGLLNRLRETHSL